MIADTTSIALVSDALRRDALITVAAAFGALFISLAIMVWAAFRSPRVGAPKSLGLFFQRGSLLRVYTVLSVILALVVLQILNSLSEGATAILSGIAGYVLGGIDKPLLRATKQKFKGSADD